MTDQELKLKAKAIDLAQRAIRLPNDVNGNPRYYLPVYVFVRNGRFYRPKYARKYRGKQFGPGWVFSSYSLEEDLLVSIER